MTDAEFLDDMKTYKLDHTQDGWPAVQQWEIDRLIGMIESLTAEIAAANERIVTLEAIPANKGASFYADKLRAATVRILELEDGLKTLLVIIHKDGGQTTQKQGLAESIKYAIKVHGGLKVKIEELEGKLKNASHNARFYSDKCIELEAQL